MFKLLELNIRDHHFLGDLNLNFVNNGEENYGPYTTILIGPNGTGKSYILRLIIESFRDLRHSYFSKNISLKYFVNKIEYKINFEEKLAGKLRRDYSKFPLPKKIIANSILLNDRFPTIDSDTKNMYQYVGVRRSPAVAGTRTFIKKVVECIVQASDKSDFKININKLFDLLNLSKELKIKYKPIYSRDIFTGRLTAQELDDFYENWTRRRQSKPFMTNFYIENIKNKGQTKRLADYINSLYRNRKWTTRSFYFEFEILKDNYLRENFKRIQLLSKLDLLTYPEISVKKETSYDLVESSSGEYHFMVSMLGIMGKIEQNSLILIDEPEISLHPNWQMQYIEFLKTLFSNYKSCHFIIATHSHFLIPTLKADTSALVALSFDNKINAELYDVDTYGWSAEDVLYNVFNVKTFRNHYINMDLRKLLKLISEKSKDKDTLSYLIMNLDNINFKKIDPLNEVLDDAKKYLESL